MGLDTNLINQLRFEPLSDEQINAILINEFGPFLTSTGYPHLDAQAKTAYSDFATDRFRRANQELKLTILRSFRVLLRELDNISNLVTTTVPYFIIQASGLNEEGKVVDDFEVVMEGCRCLVNGLKQSEDIRRVFISDDCLFVSHLAERIITTSLQIFNPKVEQPIFVNHNLQKIIELLYLDLRIAFAITALCQEARSRITQQINFFIGVIHKFAAQVSIPNSDNPMKLECINETLKILFNAFYSQTPVESSTARLCAQECAQLVKSPFIPDNVKHDAVNVLSHIISQIHVLCPPVDEDQVTNDMVVYEGYDVTFVKCLLDLLEKKLDELSQADLELLIIYFGILTLLSKDNKAVRRYCRQRILPPLRANDVERPPEEGNAFRNKMIRVMTKSVGNVKRLVADFLFILCKRSVNRMIKYCGFGHSAGLLADYGFLGRVSEGRRASDSEDSETEDYKQVEGSVNPVTGYVQQERRNPFDYMTEEQKEYEAMKLANTMDKLLDSGVFLPGRIGPDGKPQAVSHVNELVKDVHIESDHSDTD
ncbi:unnamed protein product [Bursaphelenchus xylophilus]|nr:unnamed protein product [Bursaphelenchus xylophilus]CAG9116896.1 unnamed protein product [Bursaphelenchus xylophilus]